jgi:hypothetical protein
MTADASWGNMFYYWGQGNHSTTDAAHNPTWGEEAFVDSEFTVLKRMFVDKGMPVIIGEFGAGLRTSLSGNDLVLHKKSRVAFYKYVAKSGQSHGLIHPFAWDTDTKNDMNMTIINRETATVYDQDIMTGLLTGWGVTGIGPRGERAVAQRLAVDAEDGGLLANYQTPVAGPAKMVVSDVRGRILWSRSFQAQAGLNSVDLPTAHAGLVVVRVRQGEQQESASILLP